MQTETSAAEAQSTTRHQESWEVKLSKASSDIRDTINQLISMTNKEFRCVGKPLFKWYGFYLEEPTQRKNLFAVIMAGRNTSSICFRVNPSKFNDEYDTDVRHVNVLLFPIVTKI